MPDRNQRFVDRNLQSTKEQPNSHSTWFKGAFGAAGLVIVALAAGLLAWYISRALLMIFAGILFGLFLDALATWLSQKSGLNRSWCLLLVVLALFTVVVLGGFFAYPRLATQAHQLSEELPRALGRLEKALDGSILGAHVPNLKSFADPSGKSVTSKLLSVAGTLLDLVVAVVVVLALGIYFAASPSVYRDGVVRFFPQSARTRLREILKEVAAVLRRWILGRLLLMVVNGTLTALGLMFLGIPLALILGVIAGVLNFVPNVGPFIAAIPALLLAFSEGPTTALYVAVLYLAVQMLDGYVFTPLVQQHAVSLPPAMIIIAQVILGILLGSFGLLLATPIMAALYVVLKMAYLEDVLGESVKVRGKEV